MTSISRVNVISIIFCSFPNKSTSFLLSLRYASRRYFQDVYSQEVLPEGMLPEGMLPEGTPRGMLSGVTKQLFNSWVRYVSLRLQNSHIILKQVFMLRIPCPIIRKLDSGPPCLAAHTPILLL